MARPKRLKLKDEEGFFHIMSRTVGQKFYLGDVEKEKLFNIIKYYSGFYFVKIIGLTIMSNHFHLLIKSEPESYYSENQVKQRIEKYLDKDDNKDNIPNIIKRYKAYLEKNRNILFKDMPRRKKDKRIYEAIYHFSLYRYMYDLLVKRGISVIPEFPTGNGKIDLLLKYREKVYALELKSFRDMYDYGQGVEQAAAYGRQLGLKEIVLLVFVELKEEEAKELDREIKKQDIKVKVIPVGVL